MTTNQNGTITLIQTIIIEEASQSESIEGIWEDNGTSVCIVWDGNDFSDCIECWDYSIDNNNLIVTQICSKCYINELIKQ